MAQGKLYKQTSNAAAPTGAQYGDIEIRKDGKLRVANQSGALVGIDAEKVGGLSSATITNALNGKAATSHAVAAETYGKGTSTNYGHVKLTDSAHAMYDVDAGYAVAPSALIGVNLAIYKATQGVLAGEDRAKELDHEIKIIGNRLDGEGYITRGGGEIKGNLRLANASGRVTSFSYDTEAVDATFRVRSGSEEAPVAALHITNTGLVRCPTNYNSTTTASPNVYISEAGTLMRATSSKCYKEHVQIADVEDAALVLRDLQVVNFRSKCECDNPEFVHTGGYAEDFYAVCPALGTIDHVDERGEVILAGINTNEVLYRLLAGWQYTDRRVQEKADRFDRLAELLVAKGLLTQAEIDSL